MSAFVVCPNIPETTGHLCGLSDSGKGRQTRIPIPFEYADGEDFIITCPVCGNDILVEVRKMKDDEEKTA